MDFLSFSPCALIADASRELSGHRAVARRDAEAFLSSLSRG